MRMIAAIGTWALALLVANAVIMNASSVQGGQLEPAEQEARRWLHDFGSAYNRHDAAAAASFFTPDADQRTSSGAFLRGRTEIEDFLAALFASNPGVRQRLSLISARFSDGNLLFAEAAWEITGLPVPRAGFVTYVLRNEGDAWACIAGRSMIPVR